jgi:hypothetical protein
VQSKSGISLPNLSYTVSHYSTVISNCTGNITEYQNDTEFISQRQDMHAHKDREKEKVMRACQLI